MFADADLSLSKTSASGGVKPPGNVVYTIVVSNAGPDGNLWLTQQTGNKIGRVTVGGAVTEFTIPTANSQPNDIAQAADANLWFTERNGNKIGRITP